MQFEWNDDKAEGNFAKHGVSFEEALTCFYDPEQGRLLIICYTLRDPIIRLISARKATRREAKIYAQGL